MPPREYDLRASGVGVLVSRVRSFGFQEYEQQGLTGVDERVAHHGGIVLRGGRDARVEGREKD